MIDQRALNSRCAVYTRVSTDDGLGQEFNSLDAQREACFAFIASQGPEGWVALDESYNDAGQSGGDMDRPALNRLLADAEAGKVDTVVVYKVDRLTRSLADFARIIERLERNHVSFVSVTQSFSTTSSVGRLTLNILLSFSQFEREVIRERIRDKIAASKARGMWMGGNPPMGYDVRERKLHINPREAANVATIFRLSLKLGANELIAELDRLQIRSKKWTSLSGRDIGGYRLVSGAVDYLLRNKTYVGEIEYKGNVYAGQHEPIVTRDLFDDVQAELRRRSLKKQTSPLRDNHAPLTGLVFDKHGTRLNISQALGCRRQRYRYYITKRSATAPTASFRVRADVLDAAAKSCVGRKLEAPDDVELSWQIIRSHIQRIVVESDRANFVLTCSDAESKDALLARLESIGQPKICPSTVEVLVPLRLARQPGSRRIVDCHGVEYLPAERAPGQREAVKLLALAHAWRRRMLRDGEEVMREIALSRDISLNRVLEIVALAYLAPEIQRALLSGEAPHGLEARVAAATNIPLKWSKQCELFALN